MTSRKHVVFIYVLIAFLFILNVGQFAAYISTYHAARDALSRVGEAEQSIEVIRAHTENRRMHRRPLGGW